MVNTWHFTTNDVDFEIESGVFVAALNELYDAVYGESNGAANCYVWANTMARCYDLSTPTPRVPVEIGMPITASAVSTLVPSEAACVLSYAADPTPGIPAGRQRGRIYFGGLGPFWDSASAVDAWPTISPTAITALGSAANALIDDLTVTGVRWVVHSRVAGADFEVTHGWIDNAWDTQRRRGGDYSSRIPWQP